jgi:hypothetical protein
MSKAITKEEARDIFIDQCRVIIDYWASQNDNTDKEKIEGAVFSIMNIFDGSCGGFPAAIDLVLRPHEDDKQYNIDNGDNWIVDGQVINDDCHLHEIIYSNN